VSALDAKLQRPEGPWRGGGTRLRRLGHDFELVDAPGSLTVDGAEAVGAGVAATDDDDALVLGIDRLGGIG
jgi:hypothetical protein